MSSRERVQQQTEGASAEIRCAHVLWIFSLFPLLFIPLTHSLSDLRHSHRAHRHTRTPETHIHTQAEMVIKRDTSPMCDRQSGCRFTVQPSSQLDNRISSRSLVVCGTHKSICLSASVGSRLLSFLTKNQGNRRTRTSFVS